MVKIIGITGSYCAGKDTIADFLVKCGWENFSLSDEIREILKKENIEPTRNNLIKRGNELRVKFGSQILAKMTFRKVKYSAVLTSIRNSAEIEYLKDSSDFYLIFVDAPIEERYKRAQKRIKETDFVSFEKFKKQELSEKSEEKNKQQLDLCKNKADFIIINDKSLRDLYKKIKRTLDEINK